MRKYAKLYHIASSPRLWGAASCALALSAACMPAHASSFAVIASVSGGPQIGAISGNTLYGTVAYNGDGQLFTLTAAGGTYTYKLLHSFNASVDGSNPDARLALGAGGNLYGAAPGGGANGAGTLWEYTAAGKMLTRHSFGAGGDGSAPLQGPSLGPDGMVFDATAEGAIGGSGNIFSLTHSGTYAVIYEFMSQGDGHCPFSGVAFGPGGALYGTTVGVGFGGNPQGSVWQYTAAGGLRTLHVFTDGADGEYPKQAPVVDGAGNVYGTTNIQGGNNFAGAIWKISSTGAFSILHAMNGATDGYGPNSPLMIDTDGKLYGTTGSGGQYGYGTVFSITKTGAFALVHAFANTGDGAQPTGNLIHDTSGNIYGGTAYGPVFKITP